MTVVVTLYRQGALMILTLTEVPKLGLKYEYNGCTLYLY